MSSPQMITMFGFFAIGLFLLALRGCLRAAVGSDLLEGALFAVSFAAEVLFLLMAQFPGDLVADRV
jgi:hypothetical protein